MLAEILPPTAVGEEAFDDPPDVWLYPEEAAVVAKAVVKRQREFGTARWCARVALGKLGLPPAPILPGPRGAPSWPAGVVGSMTHCAGYRGAAVAHARDIASIGIDAEPHGPLPDGVCGAIARPEEADALAALAARADGVCWDRLLFCAKESVYKAWFPLTGRWLGFGEASVTFDPAGHAFTARLLVPGPEVDGQQLAEFAGRWLVRGGLVLVSVAVPATEGSTRHASHTDHAPKPPA
jgi:4'-phosphopantetheinyl transferase EntD